MSNNSPSFFDHNFETVPESSFKSIIKVIGVGGGGSNAVRHMDNMKIKGADLIICNTDSQALASNPVKTKIKLGEQGLGAGTDPEVGKKAALESKEKIEALLTLGTEMIFITAGMGGGTGTGAAPVIAEIAREKGLLTVAVVTAPYSWEGKDKIQYALNGIQELKTHCDTVLVVMNDKLAQIYESLAVKDAFAKADDVLAKAVKSVVDVIAKPGDINTDFMDVKKVLRNAGQAMMSSALGKGDKRALDAISDALESPLLNSQEIKGAKRILITVATSSNNDMKMDEQTSIVKYLMERVSTQADMVKFGFSTDETLGDDLYLTVIAAGFEHEQNALDEFLFGDTSHYGSAENPALKPGETFEFSDVEGKANAHAHESEEVRFSKLMDIYKKGGIDPKEFAIPTYQRNNIPLYDINRVSQNEWIASNLFD
jgi:cell division protein FtsZ